MKMEVGPKVKTCTAMKGSAASMMYIKSPTEFAGILDLCRVKAYSQAGIGSA